MKINIKNYVIENDKNYSFILSRVKETNEKYFKTKNKERIERLGYFANLEQVFNKICNNEILESDVKDIEELKIKIDELKQIGKQLKEYATKSISSL